MKTKPAKQPFTKLGERREAAAKRQIRATIAKQKKLVEDLMKGGHTHFAAVWLANQMLSK